MRKPFVAGNWKMNKTVEQASSLIEALLPGLKNVQGVEIVLCPPATSLMVASAILKDSGIGLGAQNMHWEEKGAFTGELAPAMVKEFCQYVILGHSERRAYFAESDASVNRKTKAALAIGLTPIVCVGETLAEYEAGQTHDVVTRQILEGLAGIDAAQGASIVVAYEPVWAIGTGKAASGEDANKVVSGTIRPALAKLFGLGVAQNVRVLYGGSVTAKNAKEFFQQPEIDGALVGGASLKPEEFVPLSEAAGK